MFKTLNDQGIFHPLVPKGRLHGTPLRKPLFPVNFVMNNTLYIHTLKTTIFKPKNEKKKIKNEKIQIQNGGQITDLRFASFQFSKIKIGVFYSCRILGAKHLFPHPQMLIYVN